MSKTSAHISLPMLHSEDMKQSQLLSLSLSFFSLSLSLSLLLRLPDRCSTFNGCTPSGLLPSSQVSGNVCHSPLPSSCDVHQTFGPFYCFSLLSVELDVLFKLTEFEVHLFELIGIRC